MSFKDRLLAAADRRVLFCVILALSFLHPLAVAAKEIKSLEGQVDFRLVNDLSQQITKDRFAGIVTFASDYSGDAGQEMPRTLYFSRSGKNVLAIEGDFRLTIAINLSPPQMGHVSKQYVINRRWGGDRNYRRLNPIVPPSFQKDRATRERSRVLIVLGRQESSHILDSKFFGPISEREVDDAVAFIKFLLENPSENMTNTEAGQLLKSKNPFMVYMGLVRLMDTSRSSIDHYFKAMEHLPAQYTKGLFVALRRHRPVISDFKAALPKALAQFLLKTSPEKQQGLLTELNRIVGYKNSVTKKALRGDEHLIAALEDLAKSRSAEPKWANVVSQCERLARSLRDD